MSGKGRRLKAKLLSTSEGLNLQVGDFDTSIYIN